MTAHVADRAAALLRQWPACEYPLRDWHRRWQGTESAVGLRRIQSAGVQGRHGKIAGEKMGRLRLSIDIDKAIRPEPQRRRTRNERPGECPPAGALTIDM